MKTASKLDELIEIARASFFGVILGDILKSIKGGSHIAPFTLAMTGIGHLAELEWASAYPDVFDERGEFTESRTKYRQTRDLDGEMYADWLERYMKPFNSAYNPKVIYGIRCALVHSFGKADALDKTGVRGYVTLWRDSINHCRVKKNSFQQDVIALNLEDLLADLILGADLFFARASANWQNSLTPGFENYIRSLVIPRRIFDFKDMSTTANTESPEISLNFFDDRITVHEVRMTRTDLCDAVERLYDGVR